jgi:hypothetical protein
MNNQTVLASATAEVIEGLFVCLGTRIDGEPVLLNAPTVPGLWTDYADRAPVLDVAQHNAFPNGRFASV